MTPVKYFLYFAWPLRAILEEGIRRKRFRELREVAS